MNAGDTFCYKLAEMAGNSSSARLLTTTSMKKETAAVLRAFEMGYRTHYFGEILHSFPVKVFPNDNNIFEVVLIDRVV